MGENSKISWTNHTFNPWWGCVKVSPGCANCYAETFSHRFGTLWGPQSQRRFFGNKHWDEPLKWDRKAAKEGKRAKVFCGSMCDIFENRPDLVEPRKRLCDLILATPNLTWLLLTKRPENILYLLQETESILGISLPDNVWLGTTGEDQERFEQRWRNLEYAGMALNPSVLFLSAEPLLSHLDISAWISEYREEDEDGSVLSRGIDWVICGGESGDRARPMNPNWARSLRDQCQSAGVPFFFKQQGEWAEFGSELGDGIVVDCTKTQSYEFDDGTQMYRVGKDKSGDLLDGQEWKQFPDGC